MARSNYFLVTEIRPVVHTKWRVSTWCDLTCQHKHPNRLRNTANAACIRRQHRSPKKRTAGPFWLFPPVHVSELLIFLRGAQPVCRSYGAQVLNSLTRVNFFLTLIVCPSRGMRVAVVMWPPPYLRERSSEMVPVLWWPNKWHHVILIWRSSSLSCIGTALAVRIFFLEFVADVDLSLFFLLFLPFFDFDLDSVCFHPVFSCGYYAVSSVSVSAATRLAYSYFEVWYLCILIRTYADLTFLFSSGVDYTISFS